METKTSGERIAHPEWSTMVGCIQARAERCAPRGSSFRETEGPRAWGRLPPSCKPNIALPTSLVAGAGQWARVPWGAVPGRAAQLPRCPPSPRLPDLILKLDPRAPGLAVARSPWSPSRGPEGSPPSQADAASAARGPGGWQGAGGGRNQWQAEA